MEKAYSVPIQTLGIRNKQWDMCVIHFWDIFFAYDRYRLLDKKETVSPLPISYYHQLLVGLAATDKMLISTE